MRSIWFWFLIWVLAGSVYGQVGFSAKTPIGEWLQSSGKSSELTLTLGAEGKIVWQPFEVERWINWFEEVGSDQKAFSLVKWWLSENWLEAKNFSVPSLSLLLRAQEMAAKQTGRDNTWERLSSATFSYYPSKRWGVLVQFRHRDFLPFIEAYPTPTLEVATVRGFIGTTVWEFGRNYYRWGVGFLGAPLISDHGYPLDGISFSLRARLPIIGRWRIRQFVGYLHGDLPGRFLVARRWERNLGKLWSFGATEINLSRSFYPLVLFLPIYPTTRLAVHNGWRKEGSDQVIFNLDLTYSSKDFDIYGVLLVDDLKLRWWREQEQIQRKLGWILGVQKEKKKWTIGAEYASFDRLTYTHHVQEPYIYHGVGLGYPTGSDSKVITLWGRWQLIPKLQISGLLTRSWLDRKKPSKDFERYWALSLQWLASTNTLLALHWTKGYPPKWGIGGGWSENQERARFLILEGKFWGLWSPKR
ncbi:MAG: capsule assembly Wzi family protein [Armatimonadetes bacterium]|nr:capsule assembly Wzi family protein [Armatimonadota bacterium]MDW8029056.1 hypothetical protein [Armatimonadota bacterium]